MLTPKDPHRSAEVLMSDSKIRTHLIRILLDDGRVFIREETAVLAKEDSVEWSMDSENGEVQFAVDFCPSNEEVNGARSPVLWDREQRHAGETLTGEIVFDPCGIRVVFRYAIAVWDGENLYALDPEIRIGPRRF